jgi:Flp pilus assembly protein TadD
MSRRPFGLVAAITVLAFVLAGCGPSSTSTTGTSATSILNAGLKAQVSGNLSTAITDYNKVLAIDPQNKYAYYNLGLIAQQQNHSSDAEKDYRLALLIDPNYQPAIYNLAIVRVGVDPWESIDLYRHLIELNPNDANAHNNLGYALKSVGQTEEGNAEIAEADQLKSGASPTP